MNADCTINSNENAKHIAGNATAPSTCMNSRFTGGASGTALSKRNEQNCIERSIEFKKSNSNSGNAGLGLPPSGLNAVQKSSNFEKVDSSKNFNTQQFSFLKRNFSTNNIDRVNNDENSRNRLGNRKSIPSAHIGENLPEYEKVDHTVQVYSSRRHTLDDESQNEEGNRTERRSSVVLTQRGDPQEKVENHTNPAFKRFIQENRSTLCKVKSSSNLNDASVPNISQMMRKISKGTKQLIYKNQVAISQDSITPKNRITALNNTISKIQNTRRSNQFQTNQRSFGSNFIAQLGNGGSVTNREGSDIRNQKVILKEKPLTQKSGLNLNFSKQTLFRNPSLNNTINSSRENSQNMRQATLLSAKNEKMLTQGSFNRFNN